MNDKTAQTGPGASNAKADVLDNTIKLLEIPLPFDLNGASNDLHRETREKLNEVITKINAIEKRGQTTDAALLRTIQKFEAHSHNRFGIAVAPVGS